MTSGAVDEARTVARAYDEMAGAGSDAGLAVYRALAAPLVATVRTRSVAARFEYSTWRPAPVPSGGRSPRRSPSTCRPARWRPTRRSVGRWPTPGPCRSGATGSAAAACAFGITHVADPFPLVEEMARVAPFVAITTWARPAPPYQPKRLVDAAVERRVGTSRTPLGRFVDRRADRIGSPTAVADCLRAAGLVASSAFVAVDVPWPGVDAYLDYRLAMPTTPRVVDVAGVRHEVATTLADVPPGELTWRPHLVLGAGWRP